jgi:hypothetical protein
MRMAGTSPTVHQNTMPRLNVTGLRLKIAEWLTKNMPPMSNPAEASQIPQARRSALSNTVSPSQRSRMALKRETAIAAQLRSKLLLIKKKEVFTAKTQRTPRVSLGFFGSLRSLRLGVLAS